MPELRDVYDSFRRPTGKAIPRGTPAQPGEYVLSVQVWIKNSSGQWLISRRSPLKNNCPLLWEPTAGGVIAGEDSKTAALREVREELGLELDPQKGVLFASLNRGSERSRNLSFLDIWVFEQDPDISQVVLSPDETCAAMWASSSEILDMISRKRFIPIAAPYYYLDIFRHFG